MAKRRIVQLDVRPLRPAERHLRILSLAKDLAVGETLELINDHDPKPLYYLFHCEHPGEFLWSPQEEGPERWVIHIIRQCLG